MKKPVNHRCTVDSVSIQLSPSAGEVPILAPTFPMKLILCNYWGLKRPVAISALKVLIRYVPLVFS